MVDKQKAIETAISQIEKQFGKGSIMKLGSTATLNVEAISTGSISLDMALGIGGVPRGRIVEIYGPKVPVKRRLRCILSLRPRKREEKRLLLM